jgi:hypothetical protein
MTTIRIVCKREDVGLAASSVDTHVYLQRADGTEDELHGVTSIVWTVACDGEPARATLELVDVELDAEGSLEPS